MRRLGRGIGREQESKRADQSAPGPSFDSRLRPFFPARPLGRTMPKLPCSSLLRHFLSGEIVVFRNFAEPLFPMERKGLEEVFVETPDKWARAMGLGKAA